MSNRIWLSAICMEVQWINPLDTSLLAKEEHRLDAVRLYRLCGCSVMGGHTREYILQGLAYGGMQEEEIQALIGDNKDNRNEAITATIEECQWALGFLNQFKLKAKEVSDDDKLAKISQNFAIFNKNYLTGSVFDLATGMNESLLDPQNTEDLVSLCTDLVVHSRNQGILALESLRERIKHRYLNHFLKYLIDGMDPQTLMAIFKNHQKEVETAIQLGILGTQQKMDLEVCAAAVESIMHGVNVYFFKIRVDEILHPSWKLIFEQLPQAQRNERH